MKFLALLFALLSAAAAGSVVLYLVFSNPRMRSQPSVRAYETVMPLPPAGSVPVADRRSFTASLSGPSAGKIYYEYYCVFCHGANGSGVAPVGDSYVPKPSDLRSQELRNLSDQELLKAMLTGVGHEPVLESIIPVNFYPALLAYVRELQKGGAREEGAAKPLPDR